MHILSPSWKIIFLIRSIKILRISHAFLIARIKLKENLLKKMCLSHRNEHVTFGGQKCKWGLRLVPKCNLHFILFSFSFSSIKNRKRSAQNKEAAHVDNFENLRISEGYCQCQANDLLLSYIVISDYKISILRHFCVVHLV
jgi:hypothetical protein